MPLMALRKRSSSRFSARMIEGAQPLAEMPGFIPPQLATLRLKPPAGDRWIHEIKYDGYRVQSRVEKGRARMFTRSGLDWTKKFHLIAEAFEGLPIERAIVDGEVCVVRDGRTDFGALQAELAAGRQRSLEFYAFDLLYLDGFDLRKSPQIERKRILEMLFAEAGAQKPLVYSEHLTAGGQAMFEAAARLNWEGIVSKRADAPYRSDRNEGWLKIKCIQRGKFPVVGFIKDAGGIAALYLGKREGKEPRYVGKVGTGFTRAVAADLRRRLDGLVTPKTKLSGRVNKPKATWVEPELIAEVDYRDITSEGYLRHSSSKGLAKFRN
jgi:bifunctional non-homologous end joining protein LigD